MCPYERKVGCLNCPLPDCMASDNGHLAKQYLPKRNKGNVAEQNRRYREKHKEEISTKSRETLRRMRKALQICEEMGIEV